MKITLDLVSGLPKKELVERIHYHQRQGAISDRAVGFYLYDMERRKMHRPFESASVWARKHLPEQKPWDKLILLAKRLEKLPMIRAAFDSGEVPWTKIREIARIARADTERVWLDAARKLGELLELRGEAPPPAEAAAPAAPDVPPDSFDGFVGQRRAVENLLLAARAAKERGEPLGHVLLSGPAGVGKSTACRLLARECGTGIEEVLAGRLGEPHQILSLLVRLRRGQVFFLDEIHALSKDCQESLYQAIEEGAVSVLIGDGSRSKTLRVRLEPFTLVGATTELGALSRSFRERFSHRERLDLYGEQDLAAVAVKAGARLGREVTPEASREVARRAKGTPRLAVDLIRVARDRAQLARAAGIGVVHVVQAADRLGIDEQGLGHEDREVLKILSRRRKPIGAKSLAAKVGIDLETYLNVHEPWLERLGLIERTPEGRITTQKAGELYGDLAVK